jgi:BlaI family penicillinase repressor
MPRQAKDVTDAELAVLAQLWERGAATIRQICDVIYPNGTATHYATVQKLLERLEGKGFVLRDREAAVHVFAAAVTREELISREVRATAEKLCGGSLAPVLTHLVGAGPLNRKERIALRKMLEDLDRRSESDVG